MCLSKTLSFQLKKELNIIKNKKNVSIFDYKKTTWIDLMKTKCKNVNDEKEYV